MIHGEFIYKEIAMASNVVAQNFRVDTDSGWWLVAPFSDTNNKVQKDSRATHYGVYGGAGILDQEESDDVKWERSQGNIPFDEWDQYSTRCALYLPNGTVGASFRYIHPQLYAPAPLQVATVKFPGDQDLYGQALEELDDSPHELSGVSCTPSCQHNRRVLRDMVRAVYQTSLVLEIQSWIGIFDVMLPVLLERQHNVRFNTFDEKDAAGRRTQRVFLHKAWRALTYANRDEVLEEVRQKDKEFAKYIERPIADRFR